MSIFGIFIKDRMFIVGLIMILIASTVRFFDDYTKPCVRNCYVMDKLQSNGSYKRSGDFYLILRDENGNVFDLIVNPSTYSQAKVGRTIPLIFSRNKISKNNLDDFLFILIGQIMLIFGIGLVVGSLLINYFRYIA